MSETGILLTVRCVADNRVEAQSQDGAIFLLPTEILSAPPSVGDRIILSAVLEKALTDDSRPYKQRLNELIALPVS